MNSSETYKYIDTIKALSPQRRKELQQLNRQSILKTLLETAHTMHSRGSSPASIKKAVEGYYEYLKRPYDLPITHEELKRIADSVNRPAPIPILEVPGQLLSEVEARQINWLWHGRIPLGKISILDGDPGMGKSLITADLAARVSTGQPMPDGTPGQQGNVIIVAPEDDPADTLKPRLEAAGGDPTQVLLLPSTESFDSRRMQIFDRPFSLSQDLDILIRAIKMTRAILVVLDPLSAVVGSGIHISRDQAIREIFNPLTNIAENNNCAILIVRHLNKANPSNPLYRGAGSIGIIAAARTGLIVTPHPENHLQRILATTKNNLSKHASDLTYQVVENTHGLPYIQWLGESHFAPSAIFNTSSQMSTARQNILRVLNESNTTLGPQEIADRAGLDYANVRKLLFRMSTERKIKSTGRGQYTTPQHPCLTMNSEADNVVTTEQVSQVEQTEQFA